MTVGSILGSLQTVWETWNIRGLVMLSLSLQVLLILFAPLRKITANGCLIFLIWSAYLLADWAAAFAVGNIARRQSDGKSANEDLIAFWTPFLLVHLGGPDTITAFAMEDNALWLRHLLNLIFQVSAAIYVFYQTLPHNELLIPTVLMFIAGVAKYGERTRALYLASLKRFRESMLLEADPGPNYAKFMDVYSSLKKARLPAKIKIIPPTNKSQMAIYEAEDGKLDEASILKHGYHFFEIFKGLIVDLIYTFQDRQISREFFHKRTAADAFQVIQVELNFIYEVLFTKMLVKSTPWGYVVRFLTSGIFVVALVLFTSLKKHAFNRFDVWLTYCLLYGAIALDAIAHFMFIFSDWSVATIQNSVILNKLLNKYVSFMTRMDKPTTHQIEPDFVYEVFNTPILSCRWSETICSYSFLSVCLKERPIKIQKQKGCSGFLLYLLRQIAFYLGLPFWGILRSSSLFINAISLGLQKISDCLSNKLGLTVVLEGLKFRAILSYVFAKHPDTDRNPDGHCSMIIGKLCVIPLYILGLKISCFKCIVRAINDGFYLALIARALISAVTLAAESVGLEEVLDSLKYVSRNPFPKKLWEFIFDELQVKSMIAEDVRMARKISKAKGEWVLQHSEWSSDCMAIMECIEGAEFDRSLLIWHIATELCYNTDESQNDPNLYRKFSKILSDYMLYLLIKQPTIMSNVGGIGQIRFRDTCMEAKKFFARRGTQKVGKLKDACYEIIAVIFGLILTKNWDVTIAVDTSAEPILVKGDSSKSVLFDGCILAKLLRERTQEKWEIMSRVWVELLSYAASHCRAEAHAQVLSKGGELVTFVWLLMAQLGIGEQFSPACAKLTDCTVLESVFDYI
ncbi:uncharacterized protein LOC115739692 [Rhodamnia argentea]|uniref:Uncharacterized protein LOC115739692 n=1 Tax=Rhodamnia argentea TaxID=178133 RepID=A0ABM3HW00_9MYRT|nr:uncharacterized protein LOC115739692 [Rhodamnia argentea]